MTSPSTLISVPAPFPETSLIVLMRDPLVVSMKWSRVAIATAAVLPQDNAMPRDKPLRLIASACLFAVVLCLKTLHVVGAQVAQPENKTPAAGASSADRPAILVELFTS